MAGIEDRRNLRVQDLIAKTARVTLSNTVRVLMALDAIVDFLELDDIDMLFDACEPFSVDRPTEDNADACGLAFEEMCVWLEENQNTTLDSIRSLR